MFRIFSLVVLIAILSPWTAYADNDKITVQLKWTHTFQFAGFYMALKRGYYADAGLDVQLLEGGVGTSSIESVARKKALYGVSSTGAMIAQSEGKRIKAVGVIFQYSPLLLAVLKSSGVTHWSDFKGKRIMLQQGYQNAGLIAALKQAGLTQADYVRQNISYTVKDLVRGKTDAYAVYGTNQPYQLDAAGIAYDLFDPKDQGVEFYGDIVITNDDEVSDHPERVQAFMEATSQGWRYAFSHQKETVALILQKYNTQGLTEDKLNFAASRAEKYVRPEIIKPGYMTLFRWQKIANIYKEQGFLPQSYDVLDFIYLPQFTLTRYLQRYIWQILFFALLLLSILILISMQTLRRLVDKKTKEVKESEENYSKLLELIDVGIIVHRDNQILFVNKHIIQCFELQTEGDVMGYDMLLFIPPDEQKKVTRRVQEVLDTGKSYSRLSARYTGAKGRVIEAEVSSIRTLFDGQAAVLTVVNDVTERNRSIQAEKKMQKQIEETQRLESLGVLAGGIAHKFNNYLAVILGQAGILSYKIKTGLEGSEKGLKTIVQASENAAALCQQMLDYSGQEKLALEMLDLGQMVKNMRNLLDAAAKKVQINYQIDDDSLIYADDAQVKQIVLNVITNAVESMGDEQEIQLRVASMDVDICYLESCKHHDAEPGRYVYFEVCDQGSGMSEDVREKMFEPFFSTKFTGRGLGMSVVLGLVQGHAGAVHVSSDINTGTTVRVLFPEMNLEKDRVNKV